MHEKLSYTSSMRSFLLMFDRNAKVIIAMALSGCSDGYGVRFGLRFAHHKRLRSRAAAAARARLGSRTVARVRSVTASRATTS